MADPMDSVQSKPSPRPSPRRSDDAADPSRSLAVRLVTNPVSTWLIRTVCAPLDPILFRATNGRYFTMGPASESMITLTMRGRKSGKLRSVHLTSVEHAGDRLIVASAMGQERHPAWRYNLEANPEVEVQAVGRRYRARAELLSDAEKKEVWDEMKAQVPMIHVYEKRTDRNIRVFRLRKID
jgi:deazaflavin-dependent oxidoreductase (nitroreductase family)